MKTPAPKKQAVIDQKPFEILFEKYTASHQNQANKILTWFSVPVMIFALIGLAWSIPFPHLGFLGQYNGYINWASLVIAFSIYFYIKISPILSYIMLLVEFIFSFFVIQVHGILKQGGMFLGSLCLALIILVLLIQFIGQRIEGKPYSLANVAKFQFYGPIWLLSLILKKFSIKF